VSRRVVITGLGVVAPNGIDIASFTTAIKNGVSGIRHLKELEALNFSCQIAGKPVLPKEKIENYFTPLQLRNFNSSAILYGVIAGMDAWKNAKLPIANKETPDWDSGIIFGVGNSGIEKFREAIYKIDAGNTRKLGSNSVLQIMSSGISAYLGGILGTGNQTTTNSSACTTGTENILMAFDRIKGGHAERILVGGTSDSSPYLWGGFDAMRICAYKYNDAPERGSRPMSATANGFVPGSGAGAMVIESLESAKRRGATIYAEVLGGNINSGGQRGGGTMTATNSEAVQRCIRKALENAQVKSTEIDAINGHLTATSKDVVEVKNWTKALGLRDNDFPYINSLKAMTGHCIGASGAIESVASVLQIHHDFIYPSINCEDIHPEISELISSTKIPKKCIEKEVNVVAKASFGFGDVNACILFKKYKAYSLT